MSLNNKNIEKIIDKLVVFEDRKIRLIFHIEQKSGKPIISKENFLENPQLKISS